MQFPDYPFAPQRFEVRPGIAMSYLDEGPKDGEVVLMLHGNPSWSFYWRHLVSGLKDRYRCIVPDHVGMGLSDRPDDAPSASPTYDYTLQSRIDDVDALLRHLGIEGPVTLAVHDWGGMIGFGWALRDPARVKRLVITNTASFPLPASKRFPKRLAMGRERSLPKDVRAAYAGVYDGWDKAISTLRFMQDIPLDDGDRAMPLVQAAATALPGYADRPAFIGWGLRDFVFDKHFLEGFRKALPRATVRDFEDANHYVLEDKHEVLVPAIRRFLDAHPLVAGA
jgi:haloalkane dehalogenase